MNSQGILFGSEGNEEGQDDVQVETSRADRGDASLLDGERRLAEPDVVFHKCPLTQEAFIDPVSQR